jgi:hypothetical protein
MLGCGWAKKGDSSSPTQSCARAETLCRGRQCGGRRLYSTASAQKVLVEQGSVRG